MSVASRTLLSHRPGTQSGPWALVGGASLLLASLLGCWAPATLDLPAGDADAGGTGSVCVRVLWPEEPGLHSRMMPDTAQSISLRLFLVASGYELTGLPGMEGLPINKPSGAPPWAEQTVQITGIPAVEVRFEARAYSGPDARGDEVAICASHVVVQPEDTAGSSPTPVPLALGVPALSVAPTALDFGLSSTDLIFDVSNAAETGPRTLTWTVAGDGAWIAVNPASGADAQTVTVTVSRAALAQGPHTGTVTVQSPYGSATIDVSLEVP